MKQYLFIISFFSIALISCISKNDKSKFAFINTDQGIELLENGEPVYFYQKLPKSVSGEYICNNYIHPLYTLKGDTLTEEFPADHPFHRGIFWAWHQINIGDKTIVDSWIMENIEFELSEFKTITNANSGQLKLSVNWKSALYENHTPFIRENTTITVYPLKDDIRKIEFVISLQALVPDVEIGGADNEKGYGGLCTRLRLPEDIIFTSDQGPVIPQNLQIIAGSWMDFSGSFGTDDEPSGMAILCHPETPNYPAPWILRKQKSTQNIVFPGRERIKVPMDKTINLCYQLIIHDGNSNSIALSKLQSEYAETSIIE